MPLKRPKRNNYRKDRRGNRRKYTKKTPANTQIKKVALTLKETKKKQLTNTAGVETWSNTSKWLVWQPLNLDKSSTDSETQRESNMIYAMNSRLRVDIETNPVSISPYYLRFVQGWAKGDVNYPTQRTPMGQLTATEMTLKIPNHYSDFNKDDFSIITDKLIRVTPRQIYDSSSGTSTGEETGLTDDNRGLWPQVTRNFNFKFNRKFKFSGAMASELTGWVPFFAIQLDRTKFALAHTGTTGAYPSPNVTHELTTYFKDIV